MPGTPKKRLKRLGTLEVEAYEIARRLSEMMPASYRDKPDTDDAVAETWRDALAAAVKLRRELSELGMYIRERAGIPGHGPTWEWAQPHVSVTKASRLLTQ